MELDTVAGHCFLQTMASHVRFQPVEWWEEVRPKRCLAHFLDFRYLDHAVADIRHGEGDRAEEMAQLRSMILVNEILPTAVV